MNEMKTGRLLLLCWITLGLKALPHLLLPLHFRGLTFAEQMRHHELIWRELTRCWCILMPLHQWTLVLVLLMGFRVLQYLKSSGKSQHVVKVSLMALPLVLALGIAVYEFKTFSFLMEDMDPFRRRMSSAEYLRDLDRG
ncbi:MAG: hypothetical protein KJ579_12095, partial [Verrucomicrobia bacterium]|nr:hypothetical protein [Verrucomicrobiota bacterium]